MGRGQRPGGQEEEDRRIGGGQEDRKIGGHQDTRRGGCTSPRVPWIPQQSSLSLDIGRGEENYL